MDENEIKHVVESALLAAGRPLTLEKLGELFSAKGLVVERATLKQVLGALGEDYKGRGIEIGEVASGYRIQVKRSTSDWLTPLWEERAPRYTRALLETLALIAYRQPITRGEIEQVRGVAVSANIIRTLLERGWVRVVGHRDVPGKPEMFGTTREFLDYFGLKKLEDLPPLAELKDGVSDFGRQADLIESLHVESANVVAIDSGPSTPSEAAEAFEGPEGTDAIVVAAVVSAEAEDMTVAEMAAKAAAPDTEATDQGAERADAGAEPDEHALPAAESTPTGSPEDDSEPGAPADVITLKRSESS